MKSTNKLFGNQQGATTLFIAVVLLALITSAAVFTAKFSAQDIKINSNDYRSVQAQAAAQAAIDRTISLFNKKDAISAAKAASASATTFSVAVAPVASTNINYTVGDQTKKSGSYSLAYTLKDADNSATFLDNNNVISTIATGKSADGAATRTIEAQLRFAPLFNAPIKTNLIVRGVTSLSNNTSLQNDVTKGFVWSGGDVKNQSGTVLTNASTIFKSTQAKKPQLLSNDTLLSTTLPTNDHFFRSFFVTDKSVIQKVSIRTPSLPKGGKIFNASGQLTGTIGALNDPVVIFVDENSVASFSLSNATIYGIVFIDGSWTHKNDAVGSTITGALVVNGNFTTDASGKLTIVYNWDNVLNVIPRYVGVYRPVAGSWIEK